MARIIIASASNGRQLEVEQAQFDEGFFPGWFYVADAPLAATTEPSAEETRVAGMVGGSGPLPVALRAAFVPQNTIPGLIADDATLTTAQANTATLAAWIASPTTSLVAFGKPGVYSFYGDIDFTNAANPIRELFIGPGVTIQQTKLSGASSSQSAYGVRFKGSVGNGKTLTADAPRFSRTITLSDVTGITAETATFATTPGSTLYIYSDDNIHSTGKFTNACLRRVVSISGNVVTLDAPLFRGYTMANNAAVKVVTPHPKVVVHGPGIIQHSNPGGCDTFYNSLLRFDWCTDVIVRDVRVTKGAGVGVDLINVWGGEIDAHISFLPSNDTTPWESGNGTSSAHYGYGVYAGGGTRNIKIRGSAHHVRHGFTTGGATDAYLGAAGDSSRGDPEFIDVAMDTWNTWHQAMDTHEAGHDIDITLLADGPGTFDDATQQAQQAVCNIRSVNTVVRGRGSGGAVAGVIFDSSTLANPGEGYMEIRDAVINCPGDGLRVTQSTGSKFRMSNVRFLGAVIGFRIKGSATGQTVDIEGRRITFDATSVGSTTAGVFVENTVGGGRLDLRDVELVGYTTEVNYNTSGLSQANTRIEKTTGTTGRINLWTGSAWPTRPRVPAGEVTYRGPSSATNPSDALAGDILELG